MLMKVFSIHNQRSQSMKIKGGPTIDNYSESDTIQNIFKQTGHTGIPVKLIDKDRMLVYKSQM